MRLFLGLISAPIMIFIFLVSLSGAADTFTISKSSGGGFAATHHILSVNQDGVVTRKIISFVMPSQNNREEVVGKVNIEDAKHLYSRLRQIDFEKIEYHQPSNISASLGLTVNSKYYEVTWHGNPEEIKAVLDIYNEMTKLLAPIIDPITKKD
ncbi:MAG TPA: hypothetical protein VL197_10290 [Nitrospirota bacterium]|nr:hypothetical protein [Nitrospirota bacterium]